MALNIVCAYQPRKLRLFDANKILEHCFKQTYSHQQYKEPYNGGHVSTESLRRMEKNSSVVVKNDIEGNSLANLEFDAFFDL